MRQASEFSGLNVVMLNEDFHSDPNTDAASKTPRLKAKLRKAWRRSYAVSATLHLAFISAGLLLLLNSNAGFTPAPPVSTEIADGQQPIREKGFPVLSDPQDANSLPDVRAAEVPSHGSPVQMNVNAIVQQEWERVLKQMEAQPTVEKEQQLETLAGQLQQISTAGRVREMSSVVSMAMNLPVREATQPVVIPSAPEGLGTGEMNPGEFDHQTAQMHSIEPLPQPTPTGETYHAVLVDSAGRTFEIDITADDGEPLYRLFQTMKRFPLLDEVYRGVVMGLLDQMMRENSGATASVAGSGETSSSAGP